MKASAPFGLKLTITARARNVTPPKAKTIIRINKLYEGGNNPLENFIGAGVYHKRGLTRPDYRVI